MEILLKQPSTKVPARVFTDAEYQAC